MSDEEKIRAKAHEIWLAEGKPEGKEKEHWEMAIAALAKAAKPKKVAAPKKAAAPKAEKAAAPKVAKKPAAAKKPA